MLVTSAIGEGDGGVIWVRIRSLLVLGCYFTRVASHGEYHSF